MNAIKKNYTTKYWDYYICQNINTLTDKILENFKPKGRFYDDSVSLYEILTISPHPSMNYHLNKIHYNFDRLNRFQTNF